MIENYYVGAYWGSRAESLPQCARGVAQLLCDLRKADEVFARWFEKGRSRQDALRREVRPDAEALEKLLDRGRHRRDDRSVIERLGFHIGVWNGRTDDDAISLGVHCGRSAPARAWIPNSCVIELPVAGAAAERLLRVPVLTAVMQSIVTALEPDWGVVTSGAFRNLTVTPAGIPTVGWLTYLSNRYGPIPAVPVPSRTVSIDGNGSLIVTTDEHCKADNADHVAAAERIRLLLNRAGLLRRP